MMSKPYPKYKPSGVEWLGDVPEHWEVKKLKWVYQGIGSGDGISPDDIDVDGTYPVYGGNGIMGYTESHNSNVTDIIIGRVGAKCGNVYLINGPKWISDNALRLKIRGVDLKYLALLLEHRNLNQLANQNAQPLITGSMVANQFLPLPPLPEQQAIAGFLDRATGRIDALISKKERLLELLAEQRAALISRAVTKGLNPAVKLKPSGVEWLGDIPEHWGNIALKWASVRYSGGTPDKSIQEYWENGTIPWLNSGAVNDDYITEPSEYITKEAFQNSSAKWIPKDALVMALAGQGKTKGMVGQLGIRTTCNQSMAAIIPNEKLNSRMLYWWLTNNYTNIRNLAGGEARDGLNLDLLGSIPVPLPPLSEQQASPRISTSRPRRSMPFQQTLSADVISPEKASIEMLQNYQLIGFGSGIFDEKHHSSILSFASNLNQCNHKKVFIFSTSGMAREKLGHNSDPYNALRDILKTKGCDIIGEFNCVGLNKNSFFKFFGGMNKNRPNKEDIKMAISFAESLLPLYD